MTDVLQEERQIAGDEDDDEEGEEEEEGDEVGVIFARFECHICGDE